MDDSCKLLFNIENQHIERIDRRPIIASNTKNTLIAKFTFTKEWEDFTTINAVFRKDSKSYTVTLDTNMECVVPWEVLKTGRFIIGVYGGNLYTTDGCEVAVDGSVYDDALVSSSTPTKTIYTDLKERVELLEMTSGTGTGGSINLSGYVKDPNYVHTDNNFTNDLKGKLSDIDLTEYAKKTEIPSLTEYAKKTEIPSLEEYAKTSELPDMTQYATKEEIPSLDEYVKESDLPDMSEYAKAEDIPSLSEYVKTSELPSYTIPTKVSDLNNDLNYVTQNQMNNKFESIGIEINTISQLIGGE